MAKNKSIKLVVDTNLWISFILSNKLNVLDELLYSRNVRLLFSIELIEEIKATISKPKLSKYFSGNALEDMLTAFDPFIDFVTVKSKVEICRDPKDDFLLALAKDGKADYLVTGDKDLLIIKKFEHTQLVTMAEFIEKNIK